MDQYNRIEDRKERREMLGEELRVKRMETLMGLRAAAGKRNSVAGDEAASAQALASRLRGPDGNFIEGGEDYFNSVVKAGGASMVMNSISDTEAKAEGGISITGPMIMDNYSVFYDERQKPSVSLPSPQDIASTDYGTDTDAYLETYGALTDAAVDASRPRREPALDVNTRGVYAASRENFDAAKEEFDRLLIERVSSRINPEDTSESNVRLVTALKGLQSDNATAKVKARNDLMLSPEGLSVYNEMMELSNQIPIYGVLVGQAGSFRKLEELWKVSNSWDRVPEETREVIFNRHPFMRDYMGVPNE